MRLTRLFLALALCVFAEVAAASGKSSGGTVQLRLAKETIEGRVVIRDDKSCWLYDRAGRLREIKLADVKSFQQASSKFSPLTPNAMATELIRELGKDFETATTRHYVVAAPKGKAKNYVELFENVYRTFHMHFSVRGFEVNEPEFPLVAIVFPQRHQFLEYARSEGTNAQQYGGYYSPRTNRAVLFETEGASTTRLDVESAIKPLLSASSSTGQPVLMEITTLGTPRNQFKTIDADQRDTMIHECTHQVAYNVGLHNRVGENPRWIVEGLATVFEAPGIRNSSSGVQFSSRINPERLTAFKEYLRQRRPKNSVETTVAGDELLSVAIGDFYAEAWALSFFLVETRPRKYSDLLTRTAKRDGNKRLTREERLETFKASITDNLKQLDSEYTRFYDKLK